MPEEKPLVEKLGRPFLLGAVLGLIYQIPIFMQVIFPSIDLLTTREEQPYCITANLEAIPSRIATGLAMMSLGIFLWHYTGKEVAETEERP